MFRFIPLLFILFSHFLYATDTQQPLEIAADRLDISQQQETIRYIGNIELTQGSFYLTSDSITVFFKDRVAYKIEALGTPVNFQQDNPKYGLIKGHANHVIYHLTTKKVFLKGQADIQQGNNKFNSNYLEYDLSQAHLLAGGKGQGRIKLIIYPE